MARLFAVTRPARARRLLWLMLLALSGMTLACAATSSLFPPPGPTLPAPLQWRQNLGEGKTLVSPPALTDGLLVYVEEAQDVVARDAATGAEEWRHPLPKANVLLRPLAVAGGLVFVTDTSADGVIAHLLALDLHTGQATWDLPLNPGPAPAYFEYPVTDGTLIYFAGATAPDHWVLSAADPATGALRWQAPLTATAPTSDPLLDHGLLLIALDHHATGNEPATGDLLALDAASGAPRWQTALGAPAAPILAAGGGRVFVSTQDGRLLALDEAASTLEWQYQLRPSATPNYEPAPPLLAGDTLYLGDTDSQVFALDAATGSLRWQVHVGDAVLRRPAVSGGRLYLGTTDGMLVALDAASGQTLWTTANPLRKSFPSDYTPPLDTEPVTVAGALYYFNGTELVALTVP